MYEYDEFAEIADQIASDIPARASMSMAEALRITRCWMAGEESPQVIDAVAAALWRSYRGDAR